MEPQTPHDEVQTMVADLNRVEVQLAELKGIIAAVEAKADSLKDLTAEQIDSVKALLGEKPSLIAILGPVIAIMVALSAGAAMAINRQGEQLTSIQDKIDTLSTSVAVSTASTADLRTAVLNFDVSLTKVVATLDQIRTDGSRTAEDVALMRGDFSLMAQSLIFKKRIQPILDANNVAAMIGLDGSYIFIDRTSNQIVTGPRNDELQANVNFALATLPINVGGVQPASLPQPRP